MFLKQPCRTSPTLVSLGCALPTNPDQPMALQNKSKAIPSQRKKGNESPLVRLHAESDPMKR